MTRQSITLELVTIERDGATTTTTIRANGLKSVSTNPGDARQLEICGWVGCGTDLERYNFEHEFIHSFLAQKMWGRVSYVVGMDAAGKKMSETGAWYEERWCFHFHCAINRKGHALEAEWIDWVPEARALLAASHMGETNAPRAT